MQSFLFKLHLYKFFDGFILVYPVYALLFKDSGLDTFQIGLLFAIWSTTGLLFEVPFGVLADAYSRKNLLFIGQIIRTCGYAFWLFGGSFWTYAIGFILWGFKEVLTSGTLEAFIFDELRHYKQEPRYESVSGKLRATQFMGITLAMLFGGYIASYGYAYVLIPSMIVPLISGVCIWSCTPVAMTESTQETSYFSLLKKALSDTRYNPVLLRALTISVLVTGTYGAVDEFWGLVFDDLGFTLSAIGILFAIGNAIAAVAGYTTQYFKGQKNMTSLAIGVAAVALLLAGFVYQPWILVLVFASAYLLELALIRVQAELQHSIVSNQRATITSISGLLTEVVVISVMLLTGYYTTQFGLQFVLYFLGGVLLCIVFVRQLLTQFGSLNKPQAASDDDDQP